MRFGIGQENNATHTLEEIGERLGFSRERIRQIEAGALRKLGHSGIGKLRGLAGEIESMRSGDGG